MKRYYYDLHLHSCLSPCADNDSTPGNLAGMAKLCGLDIVALTDHNSTRNSPAFFKACYEYGLIPIAGLELTTSEDIHAVCLFPSLCDALAFDKELDKHRIRITNRTDIFGEQLICDENDEVCGSYPDLLSVATTISIEDAPDLVSSFGGVCYPAHIDRDANGIIAVLGTFPETPRFKVYELRDENNRAFYEEKYNLGEKLAIISSDAHYLTGLRDAECFLELEEADSPDEIVRSIFDLLR